MELPASYYSPAMAQISSAPWFHLYRPGFGAVTFDHFSGISKGNRITPLSGEDSEVFFRHPSFWNKFEVGSWVASCIEQYNLSDTKVQDFALNGKALCVLSKSDFLERCPSAGDVLYNTLRALISRGSVFSATQSLASYDPYLNYNFSLDLSGRSSLCSPNRNSGSLYSKESGSSVSSGSRPTSPTEPISRFLPEPYNHAPFPPVPASAISEPDQSKHFDQDKQKSAKGKMRRGPAGDCRLLWEFLYTLLEDPEGRFDNVIRWRNRSNLVFQIVDPPSVAAMWGRQKKHVGMNFEKMARALRYYYRMDILRKEPGEKHCYRFMREFHEMRQQNFNEGNRKRI